MNFQPFAIRLSFATIACLLGLTGPAPAGTPGPTEKLGKSNGLHYYTAKYQDVVSQTSQRVDCVGDVVGGGGSISGPADSSALNESYPVDLSDWTVEGSSTDGARTMKGYAICDPDRGFSYAFSQQSLGAEAFAYGDITCGTGKALGGGGGFTGSGARLVGSWLGQPETWVAQAFNPTLNDTLFDSYVICGSRRGVRFRESKPVKLAEGEPGKATASCEPGEAVMGGGFRGTVGGAIGVLMYPTVLKPVDDGDPKRVPDNGWQVVATNATSGPVKLEALAVCRRP